MPINPADLEHRLWDEIESHQVGMLITLAGVPRHAQPMTAFVEREARRIWFFTGNDTELAREAASPRRAVFAFQQRDLRASISGYLQVQHDRARMDRYWNAVVAAWRPNGKSDPKLTLLCMDCDDAQVWLSQTGPLKVVWEIAKANATRRQPDLGARTHLDFH
ncbi:MAG TPA: pyridoxamine 5'-phosphate oxidase family protein [Caulobacteraceae bacterium]|nr:pyridoxamine 5'-phosphate oxidase family protein [Caulobacteraceae bacterium]